MDILFIALGVIAIAGGITLLIFKRKVAGLSVLIIGIALALVLAPSFTIIPTGSVGVPVRLGQVGDSVRKPGWNWHVPYIETIDLIDTKLQDTNFAEYWGEGSPGIWGECSDKLPVQMFNVRVTYQFKPEAVLWLRSNVTDLHYIISDASIESALEAATVTFNTTDVTNRALLEPKARETLQSLIDAKYGTDRISVVRVLVGKIEYEPTYIEAINKKNQAEQEAKEQEIRNKQAIDKATADAEAKRIAAQGEADAIKIKAEAEAEANAKLAASLSEAILVNNWIVKWDGKMPLVTDGNGNIIDISALLEGVYNEN
ncbi:MAG: SPFH domain-containing protein [Clostridia bacterium]|nr:SPFH domain-containing protein [Clostridia bacterium]